MSRVHPAYLSREPEEVVWGKSEKRERSSWILLGIDMPATREDVGMHKDRQDSAIFWKGKTER